MSRKVINSLPYCKRNEFKLRPCEQHIPICFNCVISIYIMRIIKHIHVKTRLTTFVSTCRPRARTAVHNSREDVIGAAT